MRQLALWSVASIANAVLASLPLWILEEGSRVFFDVRFIVVLVISTLWLGCDFSVAPTQSYPGGLGRRHLEVAPFFPQVAAWVTLASIWLGVFDFAYQGPTLPVKPTKLAVACALALVGLGIRLTAIKTLGEFFTERLTVWPSQPLVISGLYRRVRHPSYTGWLLTLLGVLILLESVWALAFYAIVIVPMVLIRTSLEERVMVKAFGDAYSRYQRKTKKFVPRLF